MLDVNYDWDPNEWEDYVYRLLQDQYGFLEVDKVPAQHKGDFGIDYLCKKQGVVFQCYAVQEPVTTLNRAQKQKSKITSDIRKFCSDTKDLKNILGPQKIGHWVLVVPLHNSAQVNAHLTLQAKNVAAKNLNYVSPSFKLSVHDLDSFGAQSRNRHIQNLNKIAIPIEEVTDQDILDWHANSAKSLVKNLTIKLQKKTHSSPDITIDIDPYVKSFLEKENAIEYLRNSAPQLYEIVNKAITRKLDQLKFAGPYTRGDANSVLRDEIESLTQLLTNQVNNLTPDSANAIVFGTLSDWMMRCPLDFPPYR